MIKVKVYLVILCAITFSFLTLNLSCRAETKSPSFKPLNIIVILDTSDRVSIEKHPGQMERDKKIVEEITRQFIKRVKEQIEEYEGSEIKYDSRLEIVIPNQPSVPDIPWDITDKLKIESQEAYNIQAIHDALEKEGEKLLAAIPELYDFVGKHKQTGSDIWKWFQSQAKNYLPADHQNVIICITDGYLDFDDKIQKKRTKGTYMKVGKLRGLQKSEWIQKINNDEGLLPIGQDFCRHDVKFLMLEIALRHEKDSGVPYQKDYEIIREYWKTWLKSMGIEKADLVERGPHPGRIIETYFK